MNIQPGKTKRGSVSRGGGQSSGSSIGAKIATVFKVALVIVAIAGIVNGYIYLNQKITETDRKIAHNQQELRKVDREIALLRIRREELRSWSHIRPMLTRFELKLHMPVNGQVTPLTVLSPAQAARIPLPTNRATALRERVTGQASRNN